MNSSLVQLALQRVIDRSPAGWSEQDKIRAVRVGERYVLLLARSAAGEDVEEDLKTVKASSLNIAAGAEVGIAQALHESAIEAVAAVSARVLLAAI